MSNEEPKVPPVEEEITRREFLTGKWGGKETMPKKDEGEKTTVEKEPVVEDEKKITRREFLTGKWFK